MNYYNEIEPYAAQWLRNLMDAGHIPAGRIDTRSIEDVRPDELAGYTQCHFFAGIGGWALALRLAGWPDSRPAWTGSCPCQPFSAAGKGAGFEDERHLWPAWQHLIAQCKPPVIFGEQVASKAVDPWIDLVHADLEGMGYAFGGVAFPAAGIGAPHIRDRTYWVGDAAGAARERDAGSVLGAQAQVGSAGFVDGHFDERLEHAGASILRLADANHERRAGQQILLREEKGRSRQGDFLEAAGSSRVGGPANATRSGRREEREDSGRFDAGDRSQGIAARPEHGGSDHRAGPTNGQWADADWLFCTDGKWRPVEPGTFPLAHGVPGRVGRLRAYGNAIVPAQAAEFVRAYCAAGNVKASELEHASVAQRSVA